MVLCVMAVAAVISILISFTYNSSKTYLGDKKRTLQNAKRNAELSILVCIYNHGNIPTILNILEASNPTRESPLAVYVLHVEELVGRSTPLLIAHKPHEKMFDKSTPSNHIINSFRIYEKQNKGVVNLQPFTAMTPLVTAHNDICSLAANKRTSFVMIPFHKNWNIDGTTQSSKWRNTNKKVLDKAPCSVGILIDRGGMNTARTVISSWSLYTIGIIFLGGADDREAISYGMRMAEHPNIHLTVRQIVPINNVISNVIEKRVDADLINDYRLHHTGSQRCLYEEDLVKDAVEIVHLIRAMKDSYQLILVGRRHPNYTTMLSALAAWNEYPELGFFGDIFASSDLKSNISVLVIQQHFSVSMDAMPGSPSRAKDSVVD